MSQARSILLLGAVFIPDVSIVRIFAVNCSVVTDDRGRTVGGLSLSKKGIKGKHFFNIHFKRSNK